MTTQESRFAAALLRATSTAYAAGAVERQIERDATLPSRQPGGFGALAADAEDCVTRLSDALHFDRAELFLDYVAWLKVVHTSREGSAADLEGRLECLRDEIAERLPAESARPAVAFLERAVAHLAQAPDDLPSLLEEPAPHALLTRRYLLAVLEGRRDDAVALVTGAADAGVSVEELYREVIVRAQAEIGRMWQCGEVHVGEEHYATRVAHEVLAALRGRLARVERNSRRVLLGSVRGDLHDVAARMLEQSFEAAGFETVLLGASTPAEDLARAAIDFGVHLVAVSAHLPDHVRAAEELIATLRGAPALARVPVVVGGPPFQRVPELWRQIGADACAADPAEAVEAARRLLASA